MLSNHHIYSRTFTILLLFLPSSFQSAPYAIGQLLECTSVGVSTLKQPCSNSSHNNNNPSQLAEQSEFTSGASSSSSSSNGRTSTNDTQTNENGDICNNKDLSSDQTTGPARPSLICLPKNETLATKDLEPKPASIRTKPLEVFIYSPTNNIDSIQLGSSFTIQCRFNATTLKQDLRFKLRWLRSVTSSQGRNQSISSTETDSPMTIIAATTRVWTVQRDGGLDLELNDFQSNDSGDYFCQAVAHDSNEILDEKRVHLSALHELNSNQTNETGLESNQSTPTVDKSDDPLLAYSQENLSKLLPSLKVIPQYSELAHGDTIQLVCTTSALDPDPEPNEIEWTFEPFERLESLATRMASSSNGAFFSAPNDDTSTRLGAFIRNNNITIIGNTLIIWSMEREHCGLYKCTMQLTNFNLSVEATGELALRPSSDSAPLVFIAPELLTIPVNGSSSVQCETTGYPPPEITWYRVEPINSIGNTTTTTNDNGVSSGPMDNRHEPIPENDGKGLEIERVASQDAMAYCHQNGCLATRRIKHSQIHVSGVSLVHIKRARAEHQGQYVCRASNKHGSNQASALVDIDYKEMPQVRIGEQYKRRTIVLSEQANADMEHGDKLSTSNNSATFKCSVVAGRPQPRLRWLRTMPALMIPAGRQIINGSMMISNGLMEGVASGHALARHHQSAAGKTVSSSLEIYDLTRASSATSRVSTWFEDGGKSLVLNLSTVSLDDEGDYICLGENEVGRHSAVAHLSVRWPASVRIQQHSPKIARPNESFQLECLASGHPAPLDIEWSRSDKGAFFALISRHAHNGPQERAVLKFDRVSVEDAGEYTCAARDPVSPSQVLRDTIMLLVEDNSTSEMSPSERDSLIATRSRQLPKLMVRPTRLNVPLGSNVTLDCLAVSGLQPTLVQWLAPVHAAGATNGRPMQYDDLSSLVVPYYRSHEPILELGGAGQDETGAKGADHGALHQHRLLQLGSKLRIFNASKAHEGVYQCKGQNKIGVENAPALVRVIEPSRPAEDNQAGRPDNRSDPIEGVGMMRQPQTKTKIAKPGSNIELRCQVNGVEQQPATSWSRDGRELPSNSVQIEHNLWLQNLTSADEGLYLCSARSQEPNRIIQAKINLLVRGSSQVEGARLSNLSAKIVASKSTLNLGDSVTLECILSHMNGTTSADSLDLNASLDELERQIVWTNFNSASALFQDNVYVQNNLLIIYDLKRENSAIYRCNYNDLSQYVDYKLQVVDNSTTNNDLTSMMTTNGTGSGSVWNGTNWLNGTNSRMHLEQVSVGSRVVLECSQAKQQASSRPQLQYYWTRGSNGANERRVGQQGTALSIDSIGTSDADLYQCHQQQQPSSVADEQGAVLVESFVVQVHRPVARFAQRPVSFISLPAISGADHQLEIELKFLAEHEHGLILFSSGGVNGGNKTSSSAQSDYISLGLNRGFLEFRFELGDGPTLLRSQSAVQLNQWHRAIIERTRRGAVMWLDGQAPVSNSSTGKFFNLNLDSVLYVAGHQFFLSNTNGRRQQTGTSQSTTNQTTINQSAMPARFYGYSRGFQGCIASLQINRREIDMIARNRTVSVGVFECDKHECSNRWTDCNHGFCQVDGFGHNQLRPTGQQQALFRPLITANNNSELASVARRIQSMPNADLRCICLPTFSGPYCNESVAVATQQQAVPVGAKQMDQQQPATTVQPNPIGPTSPIMQQTSSSMDGRSCDKSNACNPNQTLQCQSLSSTSYKCHCRLGFMGDTCDQLALFSSETSIGFNQQAFLQLRFHTAQEVSSMSQETQKHISDLISSSSSTWPELVAAATTTTTSQATSNKQPTKSEPFNATQWAKMSSFAEQQNITFRLQTRSSYGLIFYTGQAAEYFEPSSQQQPSSITFADSNATGEFPSSSSKPANEGPTSGRIVGQQQTGSQQASKSVVANLLARLSNKVADFLAIALVDGHLELSFELGSGPAIIRSSRRINDGETHQISVFRAGKFARLIIDDSLKHEGSSLGKLSMLNAPADMYLGGLPRLQALVHSTSSMLSSFSGCISQLEINSMGPLNLIRDDNLTRIREARNLVPCSASMQSLESGTTRRTSKRPSSQVTASDNDDSDELRSR